MDPAAIEARFTTAQHIMREAAEAALGHFRNLDRLTVEVKGPQDLVSEADRSVEATIKKAVQAAFPEDGFVGEESGSTLSGGGVWVVDPIDGTQDFLLRLPTWCVSIAFVVDDSIAFGLITNPVTGDVFAAHRGSGATWNGTPIQAAVATSLADGITAVGYSQRSSPTEFGTMLEGLTSQGGVIRSIGSGALMLLWVATGQCLGYLELYINAWDCLAAICIVNEAGGRTNDFLGENGPSGGGPIVAGAPGVFDELALLLPSRS
jgi:myo-inositol-1(or 4)-monophosphatase